MIFKKKNENLILLLFIVCSLLKTYKVNKQLCNIREFLFFNSIKAFNICYGKKNCVSFLVQMYRTNEIFLTNTKSFFCLFVCFNI